jgi:hypothetical protein
VCGTHLFSRDTDNPTDVSVRLGAFDGDPGRRPSWRAFVAHAAPWEPILDDGARTIPRGQVALTGAARLQT